MVLNSGLDFCAVFGDVIKSRKVADRENLQKRVATALIQVNAEFDADIIAPFRIADGDEVRGLLRDWTCSYKLISNLSYAIRPEKMRFAVGYGELSTHVSADIHEVDGPALHRATESLRILKSKKRAHGRTILFNSDNPAVDARLNTLIFLITTIKSDWTESDWEKITLLESGLNVDEISSRLNISTQAVNKSVMKSSYYAIAEGEALVNSILGCSRDTNYLRLQSI